LLSILLVFSIIEYNFYCKTTRSIIQQDNKTDKKLVHGSVIFETRRQNIDNMRLGDKAFPPQSR